MTRNTLLPIAALVVAGAMIVLYTMSSRTNNNLNDLRRLQQTRLSAILDSVRTLREEVASLRDLSPGLGEYMTAIQLHMGKLWYATGASNWGLADYELHELTEAVDGAESLHAKKNNVDVTNVLAAVENSELPLLQQAIEQKNGAKLRAAYSETLAACNSCHRAAGYAFIQLTTPIAPPVTNQRWAPPPTVTSGE